MTSDERRSRIKRYAILIVASLLALAVAVFFPAFRMGGGVTIEYLGPSETVWQSAWQNPRGLVPAALLALGAGGVAAGVNHVRA